MERGMFLAPGSLFRTKEIKEGKRKYKSLVQYTNKGDPAHSNYASFMMVQKFYCATLSRGPFWPQAPCAVGI